MIGTLNIAIAPLLPWPILGPLIGLAVLAALATFVGRGRAKWWRSLLLAGLVFALLDPSIVRQQRDPLKDVALVVVDRSVSQHFGARTARTDAALAALKAKLARFPDLETRVVESDPSPVAEETDLFQPRADGLSDVPRDRIAGTFLITDGQVHDLPRPENLSGQGPVHVLLTGDHGESDRRIEIVNAPSFGIVGKSVPVTLRVVDANIPNTGPVNVTVSQDGGPARSAAAEPGRPFTIQVPLRHAGPTTLEFEAEPAANELTLANNHAAAVINGVRERLRVLLVSGEPHAGERTWRNLLKSDPSVDLVHFTILRPPEKNDGTPINELSLIAFPIAELFDLKLRDFDLVIFDHYEQRLLLSEYYENLANYVRRGGALLEASGPGFEGNLSLYKTALRDILPGAPTGNEIDETFRPTVTDLGERHPVTADLPGDTGSGTAAWGHWFRQGEVLPASPETNVVMSGAGGRPLLLLAHAGEGRVAQLSSDQIWLWSRGYEGGGPQAELLRRLAHWLMKEPELDENQLNAAAKNRQIVITRRSLDATSTPPAVSLTDPNGDAKQVALQYTGHGIARATVEADTIGLYKVSDGQRAAFAVIGSINTPELKDVLTTADTLAPIVHATGGSTVWLADSGNDLDVRRVDADAPTGGRGWMGLRRNGRYIVRGVTETPLLPTGVLLLLLGGTLILTWYREGR